MRQGVLAQLPCRNLASHNFQRLRRRQYLNAVDTKEHQRRQHCSPFIPVYEGMILRDMEEIRRTHRGDLFMKILAIKLLTGHRNSRVQQTMVSYPWRASVDSNRIGMEKQHVLHTKKDNLLHRLIR